MDRFLIILVYGAYWRRGLLAGGAYYAIKIYKKNQSQI